MHAHTDTHRQLWKHTWGWGSVYSDRKTNWEGASGIEGCPWSSEQKKPGTGTFNSISMASEQFAFLFHSLDFLLLLRGQEDALQIEMQACDGEAPVPEPHRVC